MGGQRPVLQADQIDLLRRAGWKETYARGDTIFAEGDPSGFAVIIDRGMVKVTTSDAETGYTYVLGLRRAGDLIGEYGCIDEVPRCASAIALTAVTASLIRSAHFRQILRERSDILLTLLAITIGRVHESDRRRLEFGAYQGIERVIRILVDLAEQHGEPTGDGERSVYLLTKEYDLVSIAAVSRATVVRAIRELTAVGVITRAKGAIVIHDLDELRAIVSGNKFD